MSKTRWARHKRREFDERRLSEDDPWYDNLSDHEKWKLELEGGLAKQSYDLRTKTLNLNKKSINDSKKNTKIKLPWALITMEEAYINLRMGNLRRSSSITTRLIQERGNKPQT